MHPLFAVLEEPFATIIEEFLQFRKTHSQSPCVNLKRLRNVRNTHPLFEISLRGDAVCQAKNLRRIFTEDVCHLPRCPGEENPFFSFAVRVLCAIEAALRALHLSNCVFEDLLYHSCVPLFARCEKRV